MSANDPEISRLLRLVAALLVGWGLLAPAQPLRADYRSLYVLGLKAVDFELWADGVILFSRALEERPQAGGLVRPYGTWTESYVPHYYLGLCLYRLGRFADALDMWTEFEGQPPFSYPRNKRKRLAVERYRQQIEERLPAEIDKVRREVEAARQLLQRLRSEPLLIERGEGSATELEIIAELLDQASRELVRTDARLDLAEVLRGVEPLVGRAREKLDEQTSREESLRRQERIARELEARRERAGRYQRATRLLAAGDCSQEAIDLLTDVVHRSWLGSPELGEEAAPALRLAQAHLQCSDLERAAQYLELAIVRGRADDPKLIAMRERLAAAGAVSQVAMATDSADPTRGRPVEWALGAYLEEARWIAAGECREESFERLEAARAVLVRTSDDRASELAEGAAAIGYRPFLTEAAARWNCGDRAGAEASLSLARQFSTEPDAEIAELEHRIRTDPMGELYGGSHALVVVAHDYHHSDKGWSDLPGAREDVEAIRHALATHGFTVEVLENPTSEAFDKQMRRFVARYGRSPQHRIVFYYAGHGWTEEAVGIKNGYVVPVDSPHPDRSEESFEYLISMGAFELYARPMKARHALFIFDTCFGGMVFERSLTALDPQLAGLETTELLRNPVRMFMTAGNENQTVPDFSVFRRTVVRGLDGEADSDGNKLVLGQELGRFVQQAVSEASYTTPQWGTMTGGELGRGDIAFLAQRRTGDSSTEALRTEIDYWSTVWGRDRPSRYRDYLRLYPEGVFSPLARLRLAATDP